MKKVTLFLVLVTLFLGMFSCSKELNLKDLPYEDNLRIAKEKYDNEKYVKAIDDFKAILLNYGGMNGIDSVQFLLAESHFNLAEYYSSAYEYTRLYNNYPGSPLAEEALFKSAYSYYKLSPSYHLDQEDTENAMRHFQIFVETYKSGTYVDSALVLMKELREKTAEKDFKAGELYLIMDQPRAAKTYFGYIIENYYDTKFYLPSIKYYAESFKAMGDDYSYNIYMDEYKKLGGEE